MCVCAEVYEHWWYAEKPVKMCVETCVCAEVCEHWWWADEPLNLGAEMCLCAEVCRHSHVRRSPLKCVHRCVYVCRDVRVCAGVCRNSQKSAFQIRKSQFSNGFIGCQSRIVYLILRSFPQKSPVSSGAFAERDLQLKVSYANSPPFTTYTHFRACLKFRGIPWKLVQKLRGVSENLIQILAVVIIWSPISSAHGVHWL